MTPSSAKSITKPGDGSRRTNRVKACIVSMLCIAAVIGAALSLLIWAPWQAAHPAHSVRYLGMYEPDAPNSYSDLDKFAQAIGRQPNLVTYYSHWGDPFQVAFAESAAQRGATTVVQISPKNIPTLSIANGQFDSYLRSYAKRSKDSSARWSCRSVTR